MRMFAIATLLAGIGTGCANPTGPTPNSPAAQWALAHINDICIVDVAGGPGRLIPNPTSGGTIPNGTRIAPISYCNPAE